jgi:hypothetical protein
MALILSRYLSLRASGLRACLSQHFQWIAEDDTVK